MTVSPVGYFGEESLSSLTQQVHSSDFASAMRLSYGLKINKFNLNYNLWGRADIQNMETELLKKDLDGYTAASDDSLKNNLGYNTWQAGINQNYVYDDGKLKASLQLPFTYYLLSINDRIPDKTSGHNKIIINPSFSAKYNLTHEIIVSAVAGYSQSYGDRGSYYTGFIMNSYRRLLRNSVDRLFETRSGKGNLSLAYRDVFKALFINGGINYNRSWRNLLYGYNYQGIMSVKTVIDQPTRSDSYGVDINGSKGLNFWSATLRASGGYTAGAGELLIQDTKLKYRSEGYSAKGELGMNPVSTASINYALSWYESKSYTVGNQGRFSPIWGTSQNMKVGVFLSKKLTVNLGFEHQFNSAANPRYTYFVDGGIKFKHRQSDLELVMNNLLNAKQYVSASYSDISSYYYSYDLRPASILIKARFKIK